MLEENGDGFAHVNFPSLSHNFRSWSWRGLSDAHLKNSIRLCCSPKTAKSCLAMEDLRGQRWCIRPHELSKSLTQISSVSNTKLKQNVKRYFAFAVKLQDNTLLFKSNHHRVFEVLITKIRSEKRNISLFFINLMFTLNKT